MGNRLQRDMDKSGKNGRGDDCINLGESEQWLGPKW